jgi:hypothetical protein
MEDVTTDGEDIYSPMQAMQELILTTQELIPDLAEVKASEPKVAVITPKFSSKAKNPPLSSLMGKLFSNLLRSNIVSKYRSPL